MTQTTLRDYLLTTEDAISSGRINDALANCQYILTHFPESLEAQRLLGEVYLAQGQLDEAQQTFDWVLTNDPENVIVYCDRALISEQLHDYDTALDCYQQAYELSRGNSEIRHEFNQLSEKVGQSGFIFSRAGLARLYMRGDLLPQAIQEWEIVLSANPDRLDARTGLLETLWREGLYDQVEQLATQILNDVPGCLKALLLLAHVTFAQNALKAQELMRLVATLDPDFVKAQELFSDFMAQSPKDPFLNLLKKTPITFPVTSNGTHAATTPTGQITNGTNGTNGTHGTTPFDDPLVRWSSLDNIIEPQQEYQTVQESAPFGNWTDANSSDFGGWSAFAQQPTQPTPTPAPAAQTSNDTNQPPTRNTPAPDSQHPVQPEEAVQDEVQSAIWQMPQAQEIEKANDTPVAQQNSQDQEQSWYQVDVFEEPAFDAWSSGENLTQSSSGISWGMDEQESETPTPPAWLDMLTSERLQPTNSTPPAQSTAPTNNQQTPVEPSPAQQEPNIQKNDVPVAWSEQQPTSTPTVQPSFDDEDAYSFGPEWLKSLGATAIESGVPQHIVQEEEEEKTPPSTLPVQPLVSEQTPVQEQPLLSETEAEHLPTPTSENVPPTASTASVPAELEPKAPVATPSPASVEPPSVPVTPMLPEREKVSVENWLDHAAQRLAQPEHNVLTTLEELEHDLRSQGFMPLEPGSLSCFSGKQENETDEATLSSALAQLGNLEPQPQPVNETVSAQSVQQHMPAFPPVDPLWAAPPPVVPAQSIQATPQPVFNQVADSTQQVQQSATPHHLDALSSFISQPAAVVNTPAEPVRVDASSNNVAAQSAPNATPSPVPPAASTVRSDLPLDVGLETTMKRPAVRLQPMQQRYGSQSAQPVSPGQSGQTIAKGRSGERATTPGKAADGSMSHKERLVRGYQYQLAGSYDEAMQEYRIIIRNAPDLLSEVISNMRALLKITPKYSAGYRVLGDAYMRQGEYLQAMEAYNKALAMAKKAKS